MSDETDQCDEIMVLQSIFGEDIFFCNTLEKPYNGSITINAEFDVEDYTFVCNGALIPLKHITPVVLNFSLPSTYPSESPPDFEISCLWLTTQQSEDLSNILRDKWREMCSAILYVWMDLLKTEILNLLGLRFPLDISQENILKLSENNIKREEEIFNNGSHSCPVCFTEMPGPDCIKLSNCGHVFCKECLAGFLAVYIADGNVNCLVCPAKDCDDQIYPNIIKSLVSEKDFERYDRLLLQNTLDVMSDVIYCPRKNCNKPVIVEGDDKTGFCYSCKFAFCTRCKLTYHGIEPCKFEKLMILRRKNKKEEPPPPSSSETATSSSEASSEQATAEASSSSSPPEQVPSKQVTRQIDYWTMPEEEMLEIAREYLAGDKEVREGFHAFYGRTRMKEIVEESKALRWIKLNTKKCPQCYSSVEKSMGCNKMSCQKCKKNFCWLCTRELKTKNPYEHFSDPRSPCYNRLV